MFDAGTLGQVIGKEAFEAINASNLPKIETMTLLQIWTQSSGATLRMFAQMADLLEVLKSLHRVALE